MSNSLLYLAIVAVWAVVLVPMLLRRDAAAAGGRRLRLTRRRPGELGAHDADEYEGTDDEHGHETDLADARDGGSGGHGALSGGGRHGATRDDHETGIAPGHRGYADVSRYGSGRAGLDAYPETVTAPAAGPRLEAGGFPGGGPRTGGGGSPGDGPRSGGGGPLGDGEAGEPLGGDARRETPAPRPVRAGRAAIIARRRRRTTGLSGLLLATVVAVGLGLGPWWTLVPPVLLLAGHLTLLRAAVRMDAERRRADALRRRREAERQATEPSAPTADDSAEIIDITAAARQEPYDQYADAHLRAVGD